MTQETINAAAGIQDLYYSYAQTSQTPFSYTLSADTQKVLLKDISKGDALVDFTQLDLSAFNINSIYSGSMYTQTLETTPSPTVQYSWDSGPNQFAQLATFTDSNGQAVTFDDSLSFVYVHDAANDRYNSDPTTNPFQGQEMNLTYFGAGQLYGLSAYNAAQNAYMEVSLKDGIGLENNDGVFLVKATGIEQNSVEKDISECTMLNANAVLNGTGLDFISAVDLVATTFTVADQPNVTSAPKVIDGVLQ